MTYEILLAATFLVLLLGVLIAYDGSRDVFHPLIFIGPMFGFIYAWMPFQLLKSGDIFTFFDSSQLIKVQAINLIGVSAFVFACLAAGARGQTAGDGRLDCGRPGTGGVADADYRIGRPCAGVRRGLQRGLG